MKEVELKPQPVVKCLQRCFTMVPVQKLFSEFPWFRQEINVLELFLNCLLNLVFTSPVYRTGNIHRTELD